MIGKRFGKLVVLRELGKVQLPGNKHASERVLCLCDCGVEKSVHKAGLLRGDINSCRCLKNTLFGDSRRTHGLQRTRTWNIWVAMRSRCNRSKRSYSGCTYDKHWDKFDLFLKDMGECPSDKHSLDKDIKKPGNKHYCKKYCTWATEEQQANCKSNTVWVVFQDKRLSFMDAVRASGYTGSLDRLRYLIKKGYSFTNALAAA